MRLASRLRIALCLVSMFPALAVTLASTPASALTCTGTWQVVPTPNPGPMNNQLLGVDAIASNDAWAVGASFGSTSGPIILHWDGSAWSSVPPAVGSTGILFRVDGAAPNDVWAVGDAFNGSALVEHWGGTGWSLQTIPLPTGGGGPQLRDVIALATKDVWAVGWFQAKGTLKTLVEHWNGSTWSVIPSANAGRRIPTRLIGVGARSATDIWAVGEFATRDGAEHTLSEHWDGAAWSIVPTPATTSSNNVFLADASTYGTSKAWSVGTDGNHAITERWNGSSWTLVASPTIDFLQGIDAISGTNAWTGGSDAGAAVIEHWNGTTWTIATTPSVTPGANGIAGVDHTSPLDVWGVGDRGTGTGSLATLAEHFC